MPKKRLFLPLFLFFFWVSIGPVFSALSLGQLLTDIEERLMNGSGSLTEASRSLDLLRSGLSNDPRASELYDHFHRELTANGFGSPLTLGAFGKLKGYLAQKGGSVEVGNAQPVHAPAWVDNAVIYQIFVDRFENGDQSNDHPEENENNIYHDYLGGDFQGIIQRIPYLKDLGINAVWITPILESEDYHGYRVRDFFAIEKNFGTGATYKKMVDALHQAGIRVILDFVANHSSNNHTYFIEAQKHQNSNYHEWYRWIEWPNKYETFFGFGMLPKLNWQNPATADHLIQSAEKLISSAPIDGFRLDYATGLTPKFWSDFRPRIQAINQESYLLGEVWEDEGTIKSFLGPLDGCFHFPLYYEIINFVVKKGATPTQFVKAMQRLESHFGLDSRMGIFISNHDVQRFLTLAGNDVWKLYGALFLQMSSAGVPVIYYGDEVGMAGGNDPDNRRPMDFNNYKEKKIFQLHQKLIRIRATHSFLAGAKTEGVMTHDDKSLLAFKKRGGGRELLFLYNNHFSTQSHRFEIETDRSELTDLISGARFPVETVAGKKYLDPTCDGHWGMVFELK